MKIITLIAVSIFTFTSCNNDKKENTTTTENKQNASATSNDCFSTDYEKSFEGVIEMSDKPEKSGSITFKKISCTSCNIILSTGETIEVNNLSIINGDGYLGKTKNGNIRIGRIRGTNKKGVAVDIMDNGYFHFKAPAAEMY